MPSKTSPGQTPEMKIWARELKANIALFYFFFYIRPSLNLLTHVVLFQTNILDFYKLCPEVPGPESAC